MLSIKQLRTLAGMVVLAAAAFAPPATAQSVSAALEATEVVVTDGQADTTFRIVVSNDDGVALTNVVVVFEDGAEVAIGDVAAGQAGTSESQRRVFAVGEAASKYVSVTATLKFSRDGEAVEQAANLVVAVQ